LSERILVTGFKPFLGEKINPSEILLEHIKRDFAVSGKVDTLVLPVSFAEAFPLLEKQIRQNRYAKIFLLGQAGDRDKVCFERVALNWVETQKPDEDGFVPPQGAINPQETPALFSQMPLTDWIEELKAQALPAKVSLSAGGYVCNYVYFKTLEKLKGQVDTQALFIHVPYLPEQLPGKPTGTPFLDIEQMKGTLYPVLNKFV
jgi:pyroglutamyl-peptidase